MIVWLPIGFGERTGSGVPDIYAVWQEAGYVEPTAEEQFGIGQPNRTVITLPLIEREKDSPLSEQGAKKGAKKDYLICPYCKTELQSSMDVEYHVRKE